MNKTVKSKKISIIVLSVAAVLALVLAAGYIIKANRGKPALSVTEINKVTDENGNLLSDGEVHAMPLSMLFAPKSGLLAATGGEEPMTAIISAATTPQSAKNKTVDWTTEFVNGESEWASGKTLSDYVTVTPKSDGSPVADITCLQPFGEQIKLTATSRDNNNASVSCLLDYKQQLTGFNISLSQEGKTPSVNNDTKKGTVYADFENTSPLIVNYSYIKSDVYTVALSDGEITAPAFSVEYKAALTSSLNAVKEGAAKLPVITPTESGHSVGLFLQDFIEGYTPAETNGVINAISNDRFSGVIFAFTDGDGNLLAKYTFTIDVTAIKEQIKVENVSLDKTSVVFGEKDAEYNIVYRLAGASGNTPTLFQIGSEYGLSKATDGSYPEVYVYGEETHISDLKTNFSCSGPNGVYHSGNGSGNASYKFNGWYLDDAKTVPFNGVIPAGTVGDITLYADITVTASHNY